MFTPHHQNAVPIEGGGHAGWETMWHVQEVGDYLIKIHSQRKAHYILQMFVIQSEYCYRSIYIQEPKDYYIQTYD
jgi:hypothetical protein